MREIVDRLFPRRDAGSDPFLLLGNFHEGGDAPPEVTEEEMRNAFRRMSLRKVPWPDGIVGKIWFLARDVLGEPLRQLYDRCLREGVFPSA